MTRNEEFVREARSSLQDLTNGLVEIERDGGSREQVDDLFRTAHTLKGNCSMAGLEEASHLAHAIEDYLSGLRDGAVPVNAELTDAALAAVDDIAAMLDEYQEGAVVTEAAPSVSTLRERTEQYRDVHGSHSESSSDDEPPEAIPPESTDEFDPSVVEALGSASEFDDLDQLLAKMDDPDEEDMAPWGKLDGEQTTDGVESPADAIDPGEESGGTAAQSTATETSSESSSVSMNQFAAIKRDVEADDISSLDDELVDVEFGEFDDDDTMSIQDLVEGDLTDDDDALDDALDGDDALDDTADAEPAETPADTDDSDANDTIELSDFEVLEDTNTSEDVPAEAADAPSVEPEGVTANDAEPANPFEAAEVVDPTERGPSDADDTVDPEDGTAVSAASAFETGELDFPDEGSVSERDDVAFSDDDEPFDLSDDDEPFDLSDDDEPFDLSDDGEPFDLSDDREVDGDDAVADAALADASPEPAAEETEDIDFADVGFDDIEDFGDDAVADESELGVSFDRDTDTVAFAERFAERFGSDVGSDDVVPLVQSAATTIEESTLDAARFQSSGPAELPLEFDTDRETDRIQSMTVDVENADTLLNLVEELSLTQLRLKQAADDGLGDHLSALNSVTSELRRTVMDLRLMPLSTAVEGLPRVVRDLARQQDKEVAFEVDDEGVHLDRSLVEKLGDPLVHLVRNAVDHGIESPDERERQGKPREGTVELRAWRERERVIIEVEDDGTGVSAERVRQQAIDHDIVSRERAERMPLDEVYDLVFEPGFSTADEVTDVSGRGVGMDAVRRTINSLDGTVTVKSEPDAGTTVRMRLPVSVAVSEMLFVSAGSERYAVPTDVVDSVTVLDEDALTDDGHVAVDWPEEDETDRPDQLPFVDLCETFEVLSAADRTAEVDEDRPGRSRVLVRLDPEVRQLALVCDDVGDAREVVVKPYEKLLGDVPGISGATMGGDGTLVNIIEIATL